MSKEETINIFEKQIYKNSFINVFHVIFVFPILFYIGYENGINEKPIDKGFAKFIIGLACVILLYHGYLFLKKNKIINI